MTPKCHETACNGRFAALGASRAVSSRPRVLWDHPVLAVVSDGFDVTVATHLTFLRSNLHLLVSYSYGVGRACEPSPKE